MSAPVNVPLNSRGKLASSLPAEQLAEITELFEFRRTGYSLDAPFYTDPTIFNIDMEAIFGQHWIFAASIAELPEPGDYVTVDYGPYSLIVLRNDDGGVNVLHNVCRHRGARVLTEPAGSTGNLVCGYHSWTYSPEGNLIHASAPGETKFDKGCFGLKRAHSRVVAGLIFVCIADEPPTDFDETAKIFEPYLAPHDLSKTKIAYQQNIIEEGNWKLVMENNRECYHCDGHPELACSLFPTWGLTEGLIPPHLEEVWDRNKEAQSSLEERCRRYGLPYEVVEELDTRVAGIRISRESLDGDGESFSPTGTGSPRSCSATCGTSALAAARCTCSPTAGSTSRATTSSRSASSPSTNTRPWYAPPGWWLTTPRKASTTTWRSSPTPGSRPICRTRRSWSCARRAPAAPPTSPART